MSKGKYIDGQIYEFRYLKNIMVDEEYLAFEDSYEDRFLLPAEYYSDYQLVPGQMVKCMVVRTDCTGKLSFEPEHPYYKLGEIYDFKYIKMSITSEREINPSTGLSEITKDFEMVVADMYGNFHTVEALSWQRHKSIKTETIKCQLLKIVKGNFYLINLTSKKPFLHRILSLISRNS